MTQTMTQHTPGPWYPTAHSSGRYSVVCAHAYDIATIDDRGNGAGVNAANARLIAAAPDLLAALRGLLPMWESGINEPWVTAAREAIAKAEGGA